MRTVLDANPGLGLRELCPLVQAACELPSMNIATLSRFITVRGFVRVLPKGAELKADRFYGELLPEHLPIVLGWCAGRRRAGLVRLQQLVDRHLGFSVSKATLKAFLVDQGALVDGRLAAPSTSADSPAHQVKTAAGAAVRWVPSVSPTRGASLPASEPVNRGRPRYSGLGRLLTTSTE